MAIPLAVAAVGAKALLEIGQGFMARGAARVQARFAEVAAERRGLSAMASAESMIAGQNVELQTSGFAGGGEAIADADRTRGAMDFEAARYQGWAAAQQLKAQGRNAVIAGFGKALGTLGGAFPKTPAGGGAGGGDNSGGYLDWLERNQRGQMQDRARRGTAGGAGGVGGG